MTNHFLEINYEPTERWLRPILARLHQSSSTIIKERMEAWGETPLRKLGLAIGTKLTMLPIVVARANRQIQFLSEQLDESRVDRCLNQGAAYRLSDQSFPFEILVDLRLISLFESRSTYEIVGRFLKEFFSHILGRDVSQEELQALLKAEGIDTQWIQELRKNRMLFFHNTAPWLAIHILSKAPLRFELVLLKKVARDATTPGDRLVDSVAAGAWDQPNSPARSSHSGRKLSPTHAEIERSHPTSPRQDPAQRKGSSGCRRLCILALDHGQNQCRQQRWRLRLSPRHVPINRIRWQPPSVPTAGVRKGPRTDAAIAPVRTAGEATSANHQLYSRGQTVLGQVSAERVPASRSSAVQLLPLAVRWGGVRAPRLQSISQKLYHQTEF